MAKEAREETFSRIKANNLGWIWSTQDGDNLGDKDELNPGPHDAVRRRNSESYTKLICPQPTQPLNGLLCDWPLFSFWKHFSQLIPLTSQFPNILPTSLTVLLYLTSVMECDRAQSSKWPHPFRRLQIHLYAVISECVCGLSISHSRLLMPTSYSLMLPSLTTLSPHWQYVLSTHRAPSCPRTFTLALSTAGTSPPSFSGFLSFRLHFNCHLLREAFSDYLYLNRPHSHHHHSPSH